MMKSCACHFMRFTARLKFKFMTEVWQLPFSIRGESVCPADVLGRVTPRQMEIPLPDTAFVTVKLFLHSLCKSHQVTQRGWAVQGGSPGCVPLLLMLFYTGAVMLSLMKHSCHLLEQTQTYKLCSQMKKNQTKTSLRIKHKVWSSAGWEGQPHSQCSAQTLGLSAAAECQELLSGIQWVTQVKPDDPAVLLDLELINHLKEDFIN